MKKNSERLSDSYTVLKEPIAIFLMGENKSERLSDKIKLFWDEPFKFEGVSLEHTISWLSFQGSKDIAEHFRFESAQLGLLSYHDTTHLIHLDDTIHAGIFFNFMDANLYLGLWSCCLVLVGFTNAQSAVHFFSMNLKKM